MRHAASAAFRCSRSAARLSLTTAPVAKIDCDVGEALDARGDVHRLPEIILPLVHRHGDAGAVVDADLQQQVLAAALAR